MNVRTMGHEKMIGKDILVGIVASQGERQRNIYLPEGTWYDYHTNTVTDSQGQWVNDVPLWRNGKFTLPAYVRAGAIIPKMYVDNQTQTVDGLRADGTNHPELIARVYPSKEASSFTLAEDDGTTTNYQGGAVRSTTIQQNTNGQQTTVTIAAAEGTYDGATDSRPNIVELVSETQASTVTVNGVPLTRHASKADFDAAAEGWYNAGSNLIVAKTVEMNVYAEKTFVFSTGEQTVSAEFVCDAGTTNYGQSVYVVGNIPQLGAWNPASAVKLEATDYPQWRGVISGLPPATNIEWKCVKRQETGYPDEADQWQPGNNNTFITPDWGNVGRQYGHF